jgi:hypothetical protein
MELLQHQAEWFMPMMYIYRIPLFEAYTFSLVDQSCPHPDSLDLEGTLYQIITSDEKRRLVKVEKYLGGNLSTEKEFFYDGDRPVREVESFCETGTACEARFVYGPGTCVKEFYTEGELDGKDEMTVNDKGTTLACRHSDADGECLTAWEANERGDRVHLRDGDHEAAFEHRYDADGLLVETRSQAESQKTREVFHYKNAIMVKHEVYADVLQAVDNGTPGEPAAAVAQTGQRETLVSEETIEIDPEKRSEVRRLRQLVAPGSADGGQAAKYWPRRIEILFDERKRITAVLASDNDLVIPSLGINCESNAYYFFEYED